MPSATYADEPQWKLPKETPFPAVLTAVSARTIPYKDRDGKDASFTKWEWEFTISEGDYAGLRAWGDTEDRLTNHPDNKVRQWAEALRNAPFELGESLDTDDLIGLPCVIEVDNTTYEKRGTGETSYLCPVKNVYEAAPELNEPPF